jgi:3-hydroxyisobutyrate dehydrogenase-like beta-hydroxyacid dehydrogenase
MLNTSAQKYKVSLPMASLANQLFVQTSSAGWGTTDDCNAVNTYLIGRGQLQDLRGHVKQTSLTPRLSEATITNLLIGIHTAVAVEVLRFAKRLGIEPAVVRTVVKDAAGSSVVFDKVCAQLETKPQLSLRSLEDFDTISQNLVSERAALYSGVPCDP